MQRWAGAPVLHFRAAPRGAGAEGHPSSQDAQQGRCICAPRTSGAGQCRVGWGGPVHCGSSAGALASTPHDSTPTPSSKGTSHASRHCRCPQTGGGGQLLCSGRCCRQALPCSSGSLMGPLVKTILVMMLLDPAFLLTQEHQDLPTMEPLPSLNMKFDPRKMKLTWDCRENTTVTQCKMNTKDWVLKKVKEKQCHCIFQNSIIHGGATLQVTATINQRQITEKVFFTNPGGEGTAAQNVSCCVYDADFMNCTWARGPAAPCDVQYFFYIQDLKREREIECPHYVEDAGTHLGCHLEGVSELPSNIYILVNGTSRNTGIQFFDDILMLKKIEIYNPPSNITVHCKASHCLIQWEKPKSRLSQSNREFQYQLDIHRQNSMQPSDHQLVEVSGDSENKYNFRSPQPAARHTVQIRSADSRLLQWGAWSPPAEFVTDTWDVSKSCE